MIRNLKVLMAAAMALAAFGALAAAASAATPATFTAPGAGAAVTTISSERDAANPSGGQTSGQTAHQVFDIRKADGTGVLSITCNEAFATGSETTGEKTEAITATIDFRASAASPNCTFAGQTVTVSTGKCEFVFTATGQVHIQDDGTPAPTENCVHGEKPIVFENGVLGCKVEVGAQTINGVTYHNIKLKFKEKVGEKEEEVERDAVTLEANNLAVQYNASGVGCPYGTTDNGLYTTGNTIVKGERSGKIVNVLWDAATP